MLSALKEKYVITTNWAGKLYCALLLKWNYLAQTVQLLMPGYIEAALNKFQHEMPSKPQHAPHACAKPVYDRTVQAPIPVDESPPLNAKEINWLPQVVGRLLYYARAVDLSMLVALSILAEEQTKGTKYTEAAAAQLLD